jgi:Ser/Thr protein kinase RdoA (MazF antagonist)
MDRAAYLQQLHARFALPAEIITAFVERVTGRRPVARRRLISGDENEVHRIELDDGSVIYLRVTFPGTALSKYDHEAAAMAQAGRHRVPVPDVLGLETLTTPDGPRAAMLVAAAPGRQLAGLLPDLSPDHRRMIMTDLGRVLGILHSIAMPGVGRPDEQGNWADPIDDHRRDLADCQTATEHLPAAGLTSEEVERVRHELAEYPYDEPVLCHGDISPWHVYVDADLRVVGLIDWGLWHAGSALAELATEMIKNTEQDFAAIAAGHGGPVLDPENRAWILRRAIPQLVGQLGWLVRSGQTAELAGPADALRRIIRNGP